jgi:hypothetical protein|tara:strand:+ start:4201 stop:4479 length:279 start_codon:yes stop_codon:yes gene_type:complete
MQFSKYLSGGKRPMFNMGGMSPQGPPPQGPPPQGGPQGPAPVDTSQLLEMLSQMPPETKLSPEEVARFIMGDLPVNMPQGGGPPMPQGGGMQ